MTDAGCIGHCEQEWCGETQNQGVWIEKRTEKLVGQVVEAFHGFVIAVINCRLPTINHRRSRNN